MVHDPNLPMIYDHGHANRVTYEEVLAVPEVERTATWNPIHHREIIEALHNAMKNYNYEIRKEEFSLSTNGMKMFGAAFLTNGSDERKSYVIGYRNAMDKSMSIALVAGIEVFICTNLALSGKILEYRKHTAKLSILEIEEISYRTMEGMERELIDFNEWHSGLNAFSLTRPDMEALTFRAMEKEVLPPAKFKRFHGLWFEKEGLDYYDNDLMGFHGAMTELQRDNSLVGAGQWHGKLNVLIDSAKADLNNYGGILNN